MRGRGNQGTGQPWGFDTGVDLFIEDLLFTEQETGQ